MSMSSDKEIKIVIGLKRGIVELMPHSDEWRKLYEIEEQIILSVIKDYVVDIQHAGSTSISGINAKPIIDMIIGVNTFDHLPIIIEKLKSKEYIYRPQSGTDERILFVKGIDDIRTHHIHVVEWSGNEWDNHILFRDYLINHREVAIEYSNLKSKLAKVYKNDRSAYTEAKSQFIQNVIENAKCELQKS
jgi:GrpB-like predicted nucleotidyltransferase (UPF0157 family)